MLRGETNGREGRMVVGWLVGWLAERTGESGGPFSPPPAVEHGSSQATHPLTHPSLSQSLGRPRLSFSLLHLLHPCQPLLSARSLARSDAPSPLPSPPPPPPPARRSFGPGSLPPSEQQPSLSLRGGGTRPSRRPRRRLLLLRVLNLRLRRAVRLPRASRPPGCPPRVSRPAHCDCPRTTLSCQ